MLVKQFKVLLLSSSIFKMVDLIVFDHSRFLDKCWKDSCSGLGESRVPQRISLNTNFASVNWWWSREEKLFARSDESWKCSIRPGTKFNKFLLVGLLRTFNTMNCGSHEKGYNFGDFMLLSPWKIFCVSYLAAVVFPEIQYGKHWVKTLARVGWLIARRISA